MPPRYWINLIGLPVILPRLESAWLEADVAIS